MAGTLPPMMNVLRDIAGVDLPGYADDPADAQRAPAAADAAQRVPATVGGEPKPRR
jgi:hypothetical protein